MKFPLFQKLIKSVSDTSHRPFLHGIFWSFSGNFLSQAVTFVIMVLLARHWGNILYGEFAIILATSLFFSELAGIGLGITSTKYISQYLTSDKIFTGQVIGNTLIIGFISGLVFSVFYFIFSPEISARYLNIPALVTELKISAVLLLVTAYNGVTASILFGFEKFKKLTTVNLIRAVLALPLTFTGVYFFDLKGAIYALVALGIIQLILQLRIIHSSTTEMNISISFMLQKSVIKRIARFGFTIFITNIIVSLALWLTNVLLAHQSGGIGEVGLLNVANQWRAILSFLPAVMIQTLLPVLSGKMDPASSTEFNKTLSLSVNLITLVLFPVCSFLMLCAPYIIQLFGPSYLHGEIALIGIFLSSFISGIVSLFGPVLQSREKLLIAFLFNLLFGVLLISIIFIFGNRYGAASYTFGSAAAYIVSTLILFRYYIRHHMDKASRHRILLAIFNAVLIATLCIVNHFYQGMIFSAAIALTIFICTYAIMDPWFLHLRKYLSTDK